MATVTGFLAIGLILYLPIEPSILAILPPSWYWGFRLAPDALIATVAATVILTELRSLSLQGRFLLLIAAVSGIVVAMDASRGFAPADTVNALRVVLRYPILGLAIWRYADRLPWLRSRLLLALLVAGAVELASGVVEVSVRLLTPSLLGFDRLWLIDGTTGRYDRFGFSMAALVVVVILRSRDRFDRRLLLVIVGAFALLALTTSRQAMLALAVAALALAVGRFSWRRRLSLVAISATLLLMTVLVPSAIPTAQTPSTPPSDSGLPRKYGEDGVPPGTVIITTYKGATEFSIDPNRNFRLFLNAVLMPWAAYKEPVLGFGPQQHVNPLADSRLRTFVTSAGMDWKYATNFIGDSNYASLVIQFGLLIPAALVLGLLYLIWSAFRTARRPGWRPLQLLGFSLGVAFMVAAVFGPIFEQRLSSSVLWISLFGAFADRNSDP
ncbi:MAG: O-antigen ligase family protein [Chloroflexi bacterium]|nr:O-antigen ligase family protein [Chloroflexota bacterium]